MASCSSGSKNAVPPESLPMEEINLDNTNAFTATDHHWRIAGNVYADRQQPHHMEIAAGKGILVCDLSGNTADSTELRTKLVHGDLDLELDFMLSADAAASILFQGKYTLQLKDSWLKDSVTNTDCGAIEGRPPVLNACKAPGLWQHLSVKYKALRPSTPDSNGVYSASESGFASVELNGRAVSRLQIINTHDTALRDVPGPLRFIVHKGPVVFRNIRYKTYGNDRAKLADMRFRVYKGVYKNHDTLQQLTPVKSGSTDSLTFHTGDKRAHLLVEGKLLVPVTGQYIFRLQAGGPVRLMIDGNEIANNGGTRDYQRAFYGDTTLEKGGHTFQLSYANYDESLVLLYEGPHIPFTALTTPASERMAEISPQMEYPVRNAPAVQRGFIEHRGKVNPYSIAVGMPGGLNYAYDMVNYSPLMTWHGRYLDIAEMWHERGEKQLEKPLGAALELAGTPSIAELQAPDAPWPDSIREDSSSYTNRGYKLLPDGLPVYLYTLHQWSVEDYLHPRSDRKGLIREVTVTNNGSTNGNAWWLMASGGVIEKLPDGSYAVDDKQYYIETALSPQIVQSKGQYRLLVPLPADSKKVNIHYSIIW
ncbi:family 16 glycoside hydrolase [Chitinophaga sp. ARDCPP14]|uniref:family 16 glycoside hydrolase n=1 Tax=Chitinophaga sp. ARDCPP14 TaxID=3391139 RepID=UPI003F522CEC